MEINFFYYYLLMNNNKPIGSTLKAIQYLREKCKKTKKITITEKNKIRREEGVDLV